jgi:hypothetical protein
MRLACALQSAGGALCADYLQESIHFDLKELPAREEAQHANDALRSDFTEQSVLFTGQALIYTLSRERMFVTPQSVWLFEKGAGTVAGLTQADAPWTRGKGF